MQASDLDKVIKYPEVLLLFLLTVSCPALSKAEKEHKMLMEQEIKEDIEYLNNTLANGYVGSRFQNQDLMAKVYKDFEALKDELKEVDIKGLCDNIYNILKVIPDSHLVIQKKDVCEHIIKTKKHVDVGKNIFHGTNYSWKLAKRKTKRDQEVDILSIVSFASGGDEKSEEWNTFYKTAEVLKSKPYFILDLRGNDGGSFAAYPKWFGLMADKTQQANLNYSKLESPEAFQLMINAYKAKKKMSNKTAYRKYLEKEIENFETNLKKAEKKEIPKWMDAKEVFKGASDSTYEGTIYILMDSETRSCAEHAIGWIDSTFKTVKIGSTTAGAVHFAYLGLARLPHSKIEIKLGTHYYDIKFGFIEMEGIAPDIPVGNGRDALEKALEEIDKTH